MKRIILFSLLITSFLWGGDINLGGEYYQKILAEYYGKFEDEKKGFEEKFQSFFDDTSSQLGFGLSYHSASPAQTLKFGILPTIDVGVDLSVLKIDTSDEMWEYILDGQDVPEAFIIPRFHVNMALPFDFEIGASFSMIPTTNVYLIGGELKWSMIGTHDSFFNLALRVAGTKLIGVEELSMASYEANLSTSLDLKVLLPYLGVGFVHIIADAEVPVVNDELIDGIDGLSPEEKKKLKTTFQSKIDLNAPIFTLKEYNHIVPKFFVGMKFDLWLINFVGEVAFSYDFDTSEYLNTMFTLRMNLSF